MTDQSDTGAAVIPLKRGIAATADTASDDPWKQLASGDGLMVSWEPAPPSAARATWGQLLAPTTAFASQLERVVELAGSRAATSAQLFRIELPAGQVVHDLIPAVGGGYRGMTRAAGSSAISGHARLVPVGGAAVGASVALGPLIGIMALTVGAEMLAQHQLNAKLDAIFDGVRDISQHLQQQLVADLDTAEGALADSTSALLDRIDVPEAVGLGSAITNLRQVKNQALAWLTRWEQIAERFQTKGATIDFDDFRNELGNVAIGGWESLSANVVLLYRSLALDSRAYVVSLAQATLSNPAGTFENFEATIRERLQANADAQRRLSSMLWNLSTTRLSAGLSSMKPSNWRQIGNVYTSVTHLTHAITAAPDAPGLLTPENRLVIEAVRRPGGGVAILQPSAA